MQARMHQQYSLMHQQWRRAVCASVRTDGECVRTCVHALRYVTFRHLVAEAEADLRGRERHLARVEVEQPPDR